MNISIFDFHEWRPLSHFGLDHPFLTINIDTVLFTWMAMLTIFVFARLAIQIVRRQPHSITGFTIRYSISSLANLTKETLGSFDLPCFTFSMGLFTFTLFCTLISLLPHVEEATRDLNTTLAIGLTSFVFVQYQGFKAHGLGHLKDLLKPISILLPLNVIGELAKIASMSFRLFGNILAGSVILQLLTTLLTLISPYFFAYTIVVGILGISLWKQGLLSSNRFLARTTRILLGILFAPALLQGFFGVFEGLIQSLVIGILTLTYTAIVVGNQEEAATDDK